MPEPKALSGTVSNLRLDPRYNGRGWYGWNGYELQPGVSIDVYGRSTITWAALEPSQGVYDLAPIDALRSLAVSRGGRYAFRVMPLWSGHGCLIPAYVAAVAGKWVTVNTPADTFLPDFNSAFLQQRLGVLLATIAATYGDDPALAYVDICLPGDYGEGQWSAFVGFPTAAQYAGLGWPTEATRRAFVDLHLEAFPRVLLLANVADGDMLLYAHSKRPDIGLRNDALGNPNFDGMSAYVVGSTPPVLNSDSTGISWCNWSSLGTVQEWLNSERGYAGYATSLKHSIRSGNYQDLVLTCGNNGLANRQPVGSRPAVALGAGTPLTDLHLAVYWDGSGGAAGTANHLAVDLIDQAGTVWPAAGPVLIGYPQAGQWAVYNVPLAVLIDMTQPFMAAKVRIRCRAAGVTPNFWINDLGFNSGPMSALGETIYSDHIAGAWEDCVKNQWMAAPLVTELFGGSGVNLQLALSQIQRYNVAACGNGNYPTAWAQMSASDQATWLQCGADMGCVPVLATLTPPAAISSGQVVRLSATWGNAANAPDYEGVAASWRFMAGSTLLVEVPSALNAALLDPGKTQATVDSLMLPQLPAGQVALHVALTNHRRPGFVVDVDTGVRFG